LLLQLVASGGVESWVVAWRSNRDGGDELSTDGGIELRPGILSRPASVARQAKAVFTLCAGGSEERQPREFCGEIKLHDVGAESWMAGGRLIEATAWWLYSEWKVYRVLHFQSVASIATISEQEPL
jgi:hypothetical protein